MFYTFNFNTWDKKPCIHVNHRGLSNSDSQKCTWIQVMYLCNIIGVSNGNNSVCSFLAVMYLCNIIGVSNKLRSLYHAVVVMYLCNIIGVSNLKPNLKRHRLGEWKHWCLRIKSLTIRLHNQPTNIITYEKRLSIKF